MPSPFSFFMKEFLIAGALLHTFTVAPQPYNASGRELASFDTEYELYDEDINVRRYQNVNDLGIYNIESYYTESKTDAENNLLYIHIWTTQNINAMVSPDLYTSLAWDVIPEGTQTGSNAWFYVEGTESLGLQIKTARSNQELSEIKNEVRQQATIYTKSIGSKTYIGNDRNDESTEWNTTLFQEKYIIVWFDTTLDLYRLALDGFTLKYEIIPQDYEIVDIPGLLWQIISMPFAFISTAFNLTLFPGTPYSLNVANVIFSLIAVLIIIFIVRRFTR